MNITLEITVTLPDYGRVSGTVTYDPGHPGDFHNPPEPGDIETIHLVGGDGDVLPEDVVFGPAFEAIENHVLAELEAMFAEQAMTADQRAFEDWLEQEDLRSPGWPGSYFLDAVNGRVKVETEGANNDDNDPPRDHQRNN